MELLNTELDAVNLCLSAIGREPVATLDTADLDAAMARSHVQRASLDIQANRGRGYWFNKEKKWKLQPDQLGEITLPNNTLSILEARGTFFDQGNRLAVRGNRVYDTDEHTFDLRHAVAKDGYITFTLMLALEYEALPFTARSAVAWRGRKTFAWDTVGERNAYEVNKAEEERFLIALDNENIRSSRHNYLKDNRLMRSQVGLIGGYNNMYR